MRNQRGEGRLGMVIWLLVFAAAVYAGMQIVPRKVAVYEFQEFCEKEVRFAATRSAGRFDVRELHKNLLDKAEELELPVGAKQIVIKEANKTLRVTVRYEVPVDLAVYTWVWRYDDEYESLRM